MRVAGGGEGEGGAVEAGEVRGFGTEDGVDVGVDDAGVEGHGLWRGCRGIWSRWREVVGGCDAVGDRERGGTVEAVVEEDKRRQGDKDDC